MCALTRQRGIPPRVSRHPQLSVRAGAWHWGGWLACGLPLVGPRWGPNIACRFQRPLRARPSRWPCRCSAGGWKGLFERRRGKEGGSGVQRTPEKKRRHLRTRAAGSRRSLKTMGFAAIGALPVLQQKACSGLGERQHRRGAQAWLEGSCPVRFGLGAYQHRQVNHTELLSLGRKTSKGKMQ